MKTKTPTTKTLQEMDRYLGTLTKRDRVHAVSYLAKKLRKAPQEIEWMLFHAAISPAGA